MNADKGRISQVLALEVQLISRPIVTLELGLLPQAHRMRLGLLVGQSQMPALEEQISTLVQHIQDLEAERSLLQCKESELLKEISALQQHFSSNGN